MAIITGYEVKTGLLQGNGFSVFVYLKDGEFFFDTELKKGCVGVLSSDIASVIDDEEDFFKSLMAKKENKVTDEKTTEENCAETKEALEEDEGISDVVAVFIKEFNSDEYLIKVQDESIAKNFLKKSAVKKALIEILEEMMINLGMVNTRVSDTQDIKSDLGFDSLDEIDFWMRVEFKFGISVSNNVFENIFSSKSEYRNVKFLSQFISYEINRAMKATLS